ncbi:MAG: nucleotidyltransferase [Myxococcales bacterium]|nr:nucleotidyltransferase [Myxococcales bacterium]
MLRARELIQLLVDAGFEFVIVGGIAAVAHGSVELSDDLDVVSPFKADNLDRLTRALVPHRPRFALTPEKRRVDQSPAELARFKNLYLLTDLGRLDVLSEVTAVGSFEAVRAHAVAMTLFERVCRVISLDDLIAAKAAMLRPKDKQVELELRAIRDKLAKR